MQGDGRIWWLETGGGAFKEIAASRTDFDRLLEDGEQVKQLLLAPIVEEYIRAHGPFPLGKCLGFTQLPVLGGSYTLDNRWLAPAVEHFGLTGHIHSQIRDLPDGTKVRIEIDR